MPQFKQSVAWWCFVPEIMTPEALVRTAAEIGYEAIDLVEPEFIPVNDPVAGLKAAFELCNL